MGKFHKAILADAARFDRFFELAWKQADEDNTGELETAELGATLEQFFNSDANEKTLTDAEIQALIKKFDKDGSGKVSKSEFKVMLREYLEEEAKK